MDNSAVSGSGESCGGKVGFNIVTMRNIVQNPVKRGWGGSPIIKGKTYTRVSELAKVLEDRTQLEEWSHRAAAIGLAASADLIEALSEKDIQVHKKEVNEIVKEAKERSGAFKGRDTGTSIHELTEFIDLGTPLDLDTLPADDVLDAYAYVGAAKSLNMTPVAAECFVVNEPVKAAGTFDRLMLHETGYVVTDIKTGKKDDPEYAAKYNSLAWGIQMATYAHALPWDDGKLEWEDWGFTQPSLKFGVVWYIPRGSHKCYPITIDIEAGWEAAQTAHKVLQWRKSNLSVRIHSPSESETATLPLF